MKRIKSALGILLIISSIAGLFFWEWKGREAIMLEQVIVARETIQKGTAITASLFITKGVPKENMLDNALTPDKVSQLQGKIASQLIAENDQIIMDYFNDNEFYLKENQSIFVIEPSWIAMRSSSLRRGDVIDVYGDLGGELLGTFQIAYVKDESDREVKNADDQVQKYTSSDNILERENSTAPIDHIEIISTYNEYIGLETYVNGETSSKLILVQRGNQIDT
ncbi:MAG: SAF domain-containing protein [Bacillota bacterium]